MRALDLFCKAGGMAAGLSQAGFDVIGLDIEPQPHYPFEFVQGDALALAVDFLRRFDLIVASPPCQFATAYMRRPNHVKRASNLIPETRALLQLAGVPYVIENVGGAQAELWNPIRLCGSSFGLDVRRHRYFEAWGFDIPEKSCSHAWQTPRFPPATNRTNLRSTVEVGVYRIPLAIQKNAMGVTHPCTRHELSQMVPPAFSAYIGRAFQNRP